MEDAVLDAFSLFLVKCRTEANSSPISSGASGATRFILVSGLVKH